MYTVYNTYYNIHYHIIYKENIYTTFSRQKIMAKKHTPSFIYPLKKRKSILNLTAMIVITDGWLMGVFSKHNS